MQANTILRPQHVFLLLRNMVFLHRSALMVSLLAIAGVLGLLSFLDAYGGTVNLKFHRNLFLFTFFPVGILLTSRIFKNLHHPLEGHSWLLLPASALEKTVSKILLVTVVYTIAWILFFIVFSFVSEGVNKLLVNRFHPLFDPMDLLVFKCTILYFTLQAPFLIGSAYFKKHRLSKTVLTLLGIFFLLALCVFSAATVVFKGVPNNLDIQMIFHRIDDAISTGAGQSLVSIIKIFIFTAIPLVSWIICYFRHTETEL